MVLWNIVLPLQLKSWILDRVPVFCNLGWQVSSSCLCWTPPHSLPGMSRVWTGAWEAGIVLRTIIGDISVHTCVTMLSYGMWYQTKGWEFLLSLPNNVQRSGLWLPMFLSPLIPVWISPWLVPAPLVKMRLHRGGRGERWIRILLSGFLINFLLFTYPQDKWPKFFFSLSWLEGTNPPVLELTISWQTGRRNL